MLQPFSEMILFWKGLFVRFTESVFRERLLIFVCVFSLLGFWVGCEI